jgi:hypothetical protein
MKAILRTIILLFVTGNIFITCRKDKIEFNGRLTEISNAESRWKMELKYRPDGKLISSEGDGWDTLFYDNQGRLNKYNNGYVTYAFEYNSIGQIKKRIPIATLSVLYHPDTIEYHYDVKGRVVKTLSTFNSPSNIPLEGWTRNYIYNDQDDIIEYKAFHPYYNQIENDKLLYDKKENPLKLSNSILFFLNEHRYDALNRHNPIRKENQNGITIYSYNYIPSNIPVIQTIKFFMRGQPVNPNNTRGYQLRFTYE